MFDFLKKKVSNFVDKITGKVEEKKPEEEKVEEKPPKIIEKPLEKKPEIIEKKVKEPEIIIELTEKKKEGFLDKVRDVFVKPKSSEPKKIEKPPEKIEEPISKPEVVIEKEEPAPEVKKPKEKELKVKLGLGDQLKSIITGEVEIKKNDVHEILEEFELALLEGDVAMDVAEEIKNKLEENLVGKKIKKSELSRAIKDEMKGILLEIMDQESKDIIEVVKNSEKPAKIVFLGINGAGKTTTIAKVGKMLMNNGFKIVLAAGDTFRAAAIEQLEEHGKKLGVKVIKRPYGSDSTAVVYDAVNHAKANGIDAVLIDTAGRQDTNINLINELKKMTRVIKPDLKIYIGESIAGNAVIDQVGNFNKEIGLDGVILTKVDCDPKGGTVISIAKSTGTPIMYVGTGQKYEDIEKFNKEWIIQNMIG